MPIFARLKPKDPRQGFPLAKLTYDRIRFEAGGPAQEVTRKQAMFLRTCRENDSRPGSPLAFEVWEGTADGPVVAAPRPPSPPPAPSPVAPRPTVGPITTADLTPPKREPPPVVAPPPPPEPHHVPLPPPPPPVPEEVDPLPPEAPAVVAAREAAEEANRRMVADRFPRKPKPDRYRRKK